MSDAQLIGAILTAADLRQAVLLGADLSAADLTGADLRSALFDDETVWPEGFNSEAAGAVRQE